MYFINKTLPVLITVFIGSYSAHAQDRTEVIELGKSVVKQTASIQPGSLKVSILGYLSEFEYKTTVTIEDIPQPVLVRPDKVAALTKPAKTPREKKGKEDACKAISNALASLRKASKGDDEGLFLQSRIVWGNIVRTPGKCEQERLDEFRAQADAIWQSGTQDLLPYELKAGQKLTIRIERSKSGSDSVEKDWVYEYSTGKRGSWRAHWGLAVSSNRDEAYFTKANEDKSFTITEKSDSDSLNLTPAVFYSWLPANKENDNVSPSPTLGLGLNSENLALFGGMNFTFNQNLSLNIGIVVEKQERLKGEFKNGQKLAEANTSLTEQVYRPNLFLGASFRF